MRVLGQGKTKDKKLSGLTQKLRSFFPLYQKEEFILTMLAILFIFNIILENRQQVFIMKLLMKLILLITEIECEHSRNDCADYCLLYCIHQKSAEHFRKVRCLSSSEYTTRRTISSTETQCDYLLIFRVTFEAIRRNRHYALNDRRCSETNKSQERGISGKSRQTSL